MEHSPGPENERAAFSPSPFYRLTRSDRVTHFCAIRGGRALRANPKLPGGGFIFGPTNGTFPLFPLRGKSFSFHILSFYLFPFLSFLISIAPGRPHVI